MFIHKKKLTKKCDKKKMETALNNEQKHGHKKIKKHSQVFMSM